MTNKQLFVKADEYKDIINDFKQANEKQAKVDNNQNTDNYANSGNQVIIDEQIRIDKLIRNEFIYSSSCLENLILTKADVESIAENGKQSDSNIEYDKSLDNYMLIKGHIKAYDSMLNIAHNKDLSITEEMIQTLHIQCFQHNDKEAGKYRNGQVLKTDGKFTPPAAEDVPRFMEHFIKQMETSKNLMHPIEYAAMCHKRLYDIQPFGEGNGIIARLVMNMILVSAGYGITIISKELQDEYNDALMAARGVTNPDIDKLIQLIAGCVIRSEEEYCKLLELV